MSVSELTGNHYEHPSRARGLSEFQEIGNNENGTHEVPGREGSDGPRY